MKIKKYSIEINPKSVFKLVKTIVPSADVPKLRHGRSGAGDVSK